MHFSSDSGTQPYCGRVFGDVQIVKSIGNGSDRRNREIRHPMICRQPAMRAGASKPHRTPIRAPVARSRRRDTGISVRGGAECPGLALELSG